MSNDPLFQQALVEAKRINYQHGTSYYWATLFFPRKIRAAVHILYAFFRIPDEIVDRQKENQSIALADWFDQWQEAYNKQISSNVILYATSKIFHQYHIPFEYSVSFLSAMKQDLEKKRYDTYEDVEQYMYGSAAVVGLILSYVIGFNDVSALAEAKKLGYAMQLTNFLRDIDEDYHERDRIYFPQTDLDQFGITEKDFISRNFSDQFKEFVQYQIAKARQLYSEGEIGIAKLDRNGRIAVKIAGRLYAAILKKIEDQGCNIFLQRARTSGGEKLMIMLKTLL